MILIITTLKKLRSFPEPIDKVLQICKSVQMNRKFQKKIMGSGKILNFFQSMGF